VSACLPRELLCAYIHIKPITAAIVDDKDAFLDGLFVLVDGI